MQCGLLQQTIETMHSCKEIVLIFIFFFPQRKKLPISLIIPDKPIGNYEWE